MGGDFSLWLFAVTSNGAKLPPLKLDLPSLGVYRVSVSSCKNCYLTTIGKDFLIFSSCFTQPNGKGYLYFASNCKQMYRPVLALVICSVTSNETKMLPFKIKMDLQNLRVAFSQAKYSLEETLTTRRIVK